MRIYDSLYHPEPPEGEGDQPEAQGGQQEQGGEASQTPADPAQLHEQIIAALKEVYDPEIPVNIYDLGLIYNVDVKDDQSVDIRMTLTTPNCPEAQSIPGYVHKSVERVPGVKDVDVQIVWEPQWDKDMMSDAAKLQLGFM